MEKQKISVLTLSLLLFLTVFGMSNVPNNYGALGNSAIGWFILLAIYFIPLALIIAELASKNKDTNAGMNSWIEEGLGERWAFIGAWSYFIANVFYIPMLASRIPVMLSWVFTAKIESLDQVVATSGQIEGVINATNNQQLYLVMALVAVLVAVVFAILFERVFEKMGKIIGWLSLGITAFFLVLALLTVPVLGIDVANPLTVASVMPKFDATALSTFAWILFAIAGIETIGSYVGITENAERQIPRSIILAAIIIIGAYIVGFISMAFILTPDQMPVDHLENMTQIMHAQVYSMWGFGPWLLRLTMLIYTLISFTALVLWLTSTVQVLFANFPEGILSDKVRDAKINGVPLFGLIFTSIMIFIFVIISNAGFSDNIYTTLYDMSTIAVVLPYLLVALSYIVYKRQTNDAPFKMTKNDNLATAVGYFIFIITLVAVIFSCYDLTIANMGERMSWFITSFGGVIFFMLIGIGFYYMKVNLKVAFGLLITMFVFGAILFSKVLIIVSIGLVIYYFIEKDKLIERIEKLNK